MSHKPTSPNPGQDDPAVLGVPDPDHRLSRCHSRIAHLNVALCMTEHGYRVFPCHPEDKRPATGHGWHDATTDSTKILRWWRDHAEYLVGLHTSGLLVVDLDVTSADSSSINWWKRTCTDHGHDWKRDRSVRTPSGGVHVYFRLPEDADVRLQTAGFLAPHVDTRADGPYVIAAGSVLPDGRAYTVLVDVEPREAPEWLLELLAAPEPEASVDWDSVTLSRDDWEFEDGSTYGLAALESELDRLREAPEGSRNDTLNTASFRLGQLIAAEHIDGNYAVLWLYQVGQEVGLSEPETRRTIESGMSAGLQHPRVVS